MISPHCTTYILQTSLTQYDRENQTHGPVIFLTPIFFFKIYFGHLRTLPIETKRKLPFVGKLPIDAKGIPGIG